MIPGREYELGLENAAVNAEHCRDSLVPRRLLSMFRLNILSEI